MPGVSIVIDLSVAGEYYVHVVKEEKIIDYNFAHEFATFDLLKKSVCELLADILTSYDVASIYFDVTCGECASENIIATEFPSPHKSGDPLIYFYRTLGDGPHGCKCIVTKGDHSVTKKQNIPARHMTEPQWALLASS